MVGTNDYEGDVTVACVDLDTSPAITDEASFKVEPMKMQILGSNFRLNTRNQRQVLANEANPENITTIFIWFYGLHYYPLTDSERTIQVTVTEGAQDSAFLMSNTSGISNSTVVADSMKDVNGNIIPDFYSLQYVAGVNPTPSNKVLIEACDVTSVGQNVCNDYGFYVLNPVITSYISASKVGDAGSYAQNATLITTVKSIFNNRIPLENEIVCARITSDAGIGSILSSDIGAGSCTGTDTVQMDQVLNSNNEPTGFYEAQYTGPTLLSSNDITDFEFFNNVDRTGMTSVVGSIDVMKNAAPNHVIDTLNILPIESNIGMSETASFIIFARDDEGYGVFCAADEQGYGSGGCPALFNFEELTVSAIQNGTIPAPNGNNYLYEINDDRYGGGAYYSEFVADSVAGTKGKIDVVSRIHGVTANQEFNIGKGSLITEHAISRVYTGGWFGSFIDAEDHRGIPLYGLGDSLNINPPSGGNIIVNPPGGALHDTEELYQIGSHLTPMLNTPGSGIYVYSIDTTNEINEGGYALNISAVSGGLITGVSSFYSDKPRMELNCHPGVVTRNETILCTAKARDSLDELIFVKDNFLRVTTSVGKVEDGNHETVSATAGQSDTLTNYYDDGVYYFTLSADAAASSANITVELWSKEVTGGTPGPSSKLIDSRTINVPIN